MQLLECVTLTLCQQQHPDDVVLLPRRKQSHLPEGPNDENEKKSRDYEFTTKRLHGKSIRL